MESAQPEILHYHEALEASATRDKEGDGKRKRKRGAKNGDLDKALDSEAVREEALKTERELKSIKSELNLSDHTQIIKYEPNMKHGACKIQGKSLVSAGN
ncbi:hypothetical protein JYU34_001103 [Plutella xylostella]|uniref:Uncharacterized protein n=1 Tax=Plutella xylostella TaxID=51655 RepID=A0ABQ7R5Z8_PLUXY|nr:hypothetical protein JYU34_001103 [Plutella xylostella]